MDYERIQNLEVALSLTVAELVDLIEVGAIAESTAGYEPAIVSELRRLFTELIQGLDETVNEV